jgi:hypothetical protein
MKYIFVSGGVISGIGKGIATASIGLLLKAAGFKVVPVKMDPYLNVDAGTMNPLAHGETFVLDDGRETDQDLGHYERYLNESLTSSSINTQGSIYLSVIQKEKIFTVLTSLHAEVSETRSWNEAEFTAGGIDTNDVKEQTLESKLIPGLYLAGEILDVDGDVGGFNLSWAWASGYVAGKLK